MPSKMCCPQLLMSVWALATLSATAVVTAVVDTIDATAPKFWDDQMLAQSLVTTDARQFAPLLAKLNNGEPINVVAWGSSVVASHAGCGANELGKEFIIEMRGFPPMCEHSKGSWVGWGTRFLNWINETWPHPKHMFANNGYGGAFLQSYLLSGCPEATIPDPVDLVILENLGGESMPNRIEQVFHMIYNVVEERAKTRKGSYTRPPIVLLHSLHVVHRSNPKWDECIHYGTCASECSPKKAGFEHTVGQNEYGGDPLKKKIAIAPSTVALGSYYGITVVSLGHMLHAAMRDGRVPTEGVKVCEFFASFLNDHVHPNNLGKQLFADMLSYAVLDARAELLDMERRGVEVAPLGLPARPMMEGGDTVVLKQCYMSLKSSMAHEMDLDAVPRDYLPIVSSDGWKFVMYDGPRLVGTYKPGIVASEPGSVLRVKINTAFSRGISNETMVYLSYLASYEGRGGVQVKCVSGCTCPPQAFDSTHTERVSITRIHEFPITASASCVMEFQSTKGKTGTIFKITGLTIRSPTTPSHKHHRKWFALL